MSIEAVLSGELRHHVACADALAFLRSIPSGSVHAVVTDCPYGLGSRQPTIEELIAYLQGAELQCGGDFMGRPWNIPSVAVWRECLRILMPGGHLTTYAGPRTFDLIGLGLRAAGFEMRDSISQEGVLRWYHGEGAVFTEGKLKPGWEPILVARRPIAEATVDAQVLATGTGRLFTEACRVATDWSERSEAWKRSGRSAKPDAVKIGAPPGTGINCHPGGRAAPNVGFCHLPGCEAIGSRAVAASAPPGMGCLESERSGGAGLDVRARGNGSRRRHDDGDGSETVQAWACVAECLCGASTTASSGGAPPACACGERMRWACAVAQLDEQSGTLKTHGGPVRVTHAAHGYEGGKPGSARDVAASEGGASRFYPQHLTPEFLYSSKPSARELHAGCDEMYWERNSASRVGFVRVNREDWHSLAEGMRARGNIHPTRKGLAQMRWNVRLAAPPGGVVVDMYEGSGGTALACLYEGVRFLGCDREPEYVEIARARIAHHAAHPMRRGAPKKAPKAPAAQGGLFE